MGATPQIRKSYKPAILIQNQVIKIQADSFSFGLGLIGSSPF